ncbi:MAG: hypothetical protein ACI4RV_04150, partial [Eubacteriales bacterium]
MKFKRVLSVVLAALMICTAFAATGCSKSNNEESEASGIVTLNMFILTDEQTSPSAAQAVQMAINEITVPQYKLLVKLNYLTADEYWDAVDAVEDATINYEAAEIEALKENPDADETADGETAQTEPAKSVGEMSFNEAIDYVFDMDDVVLTAPQIDVFVVDNYDKFLELVDDGRVAEIDVRYDFKTLTKYIHPTIFSTTTINGKVYGVPVNFAMNGQYEFLVFNKDLLDKYGYSVHDLRKIESMGDYLALIKQNEAGYYPISDLPELAGAEIYDDILFSLSDLTTVSTSSYPVYLNNNAYMEYLKTTASYRANGYVAANDGVENARYAIEYVTSDHLIDREWTDENGTTYQAYLYDIPRVTTSEAFKSAMCVSAYSIHKTEAAELIELFNTDSELANLLQYGIEGTHYRVSDDGIVTFIDTPDEDTYRMDNFVTGNTYIKYATQENADYVENAKESNLSTAPSTFFGYTISFDDASSESIYDCVKTFSARALELMQSGEMSVDEVFNIASRQLNALGCRWDDTGSNLLGVFGKLATQQRNTAQQNTGYFVISEAAKTYNDVYKSADEIAAEQAAAEAEKAAEEAQKAAEAEAALEAAIAAENAANAEDDTDILDEE